VSRGRCNEPHITEIQWEHRYYYAWLCTKECFVDDHRRLKGRELKYTSSASGRKREGYKYGREMGVMVYAHQWMVAATSWGAEVWNEEKPEVKTVLQKVLREHLGDDGPSTSEGRDSVDKFLDTLGRKHLKQVMRQALEDTGGNREGCIYSILSKREFISSLVLGIIKYHTEEQGNIFCHHSDENPGCGKWCANPRHIYIGSRRTNAQDEAAKRKRIQTTPVKKNRRGEES
jgi:hypothetical protein